MLRLGIYNTARAVVEVIANQPQNSCYEKFALLASIGDSVVESLGAVLRQATDFEFMNTPTHTIYCVWYRQILYTKKNVYLFNLKRFLVPTHFNTTSKFCQITWLAIRQVSATQLITAQSIQKYMLKLQFCISHWQNLHCGVQLSRLPFAFNT